MMTVARKAVAAWHSDVDSPFAKADAPGSFDAWSIQPDGRGFSLWDSSKRPVIVTARAFLTKTPGRWGDDPKAPLTLTLQSADLMGWLRGLEEWALSKLPGSETRSCVRRNIFAEEFTRAKLASEARYFDVDGTYLPLGAEYTEGQEVWVMISPRPYVMNATKGLSLRVVAIQAV